MGGASGEAALVAFVMRIRPTSIALGTAGLGLIVLGVAIWTALAGASRSTATQATDFSSVPVQVQIAAPDLELDDLAGARHSLSAYRGQVVLVNLWATWCPPCEAEMPNLQRFFVRHAAEGFTVIGIEDGDPIEKVRSFVQEHHLTFPIWIDPTYQATDHAFKTSSLPSSYVLDRGGIIRWMWFGAISEANLERYIAPLIKE